jgi:uncharacterized membrane protein
MQFALLIFLKQNIKKAKELTLAFLFRGFYLGGLLVLIGGLNLLIGVLLTYFYYGYNIPL